MRATLLGGYRASTKRKQVFRQTTEETLLRTEKKKAIEELFCLVFSVCPVPDLLVVVAFSLLLFGYQLRRRADAFHLHLHRCAYIVDF